MRRGRIEAAAVAGDAATLLGSRNRELARVLREQHGLDDLREQGCGAGGRININKRLLVEHLLSSGHLRRCAAEPRMPIEAEPTSGGGSSSGVDGCGGTFDSALLPYRWLPGLPVRADAVQHAVARLTGGHTGRVEIMHTFDWVNGALWAYVAPGSGVWWEPGRTLVARNLADAVLRLLPLSTVVAHVERACVEELRLAQWRLGFGNNASWSTIVQAAAAGDARFEAFASEGDTLAQLLSPPPPGLDSIVLLHQLHYWPRWGHELHYAPRLLRPCQAPPPPTAGETGAAGETEAAAAAAVPYYGRVHRVPEVIELRVVSPRGRLMRHRDPATMPRVYNDWVLSRLRPLLSSDEHGASPCVDHSGLNGTLCTSCSRHVLRLCECATGAERARTGATTTSRHFDWRAARRCCREKPS